MSEPWRTTYGVVIPESVRPSKSSAAVLVAARCGLDGRSSAVLASRASKLGDGWLFYLSDEMTDTFFETGLGAWFRRLFSTAKI